MFVGTERYRAAGVLVFLVIVMLAGCSLDPQKGKVKYLNSGKSYLKAGKYREASIQFRNPIKLDPRFAEAYYQLAQADLSLKEWNAALASLRYTPLFPLGFVQFLHCVVQIFMRLGDGVELGLLLRREQRTNLRDRSIDHSLGLRHRLLVDRL